MNTLDKMEVSSFRSFGVYGLLVGALLSQSCGKSESNKDQSAGDATTTDKASGKTEADVGTDSGSADPQKTDGSTDASADGRETNSSADTSADGGETNSSRDTSPDAGEIESSTDASTPEDTENENPYRIGTGVYDTTGPCAEVMFAGYCDFNQMGSGILMRTRARAFVIDDGNKRVALVSLEAAHVSSGVYVEVIKKLKENFGDIYTEKNVLIGATHTHSAPGGFYRTYLLDVFAGLGFNKANFDAMVNGIYGAIVKAHNNLAREGSSSTEGSSRARWESASIAIVRRKRITSTMTSASTRFQTANMTTLREGCRSSNSYGRMEGK